VGRDDSIESFYREHAAAVYGFLVSLCHDRTWAEDLMQDTFTKATLAMGGYRGGSPRAWLFAIARNVFLDDVRRRRPIPVEQIAGEVTEGSDVAEVDAVHRVLAVLPERQRTALVLSDYAGFTAAEVASILGVTPGAARVLIHRARYAFRERYERDEA
jgi:RNA polymerase sigma factor (sigma-70 family)